MTQYDHEQRARDQILAAVIDDPHLFGGMYRNMDNIPAMVESLGQSTVGAFVLYVRWLSKMIIGPMPRIAPEVLDQALDVISPSEQDRLQEAVRREIQASRKAFDTWEKVIARRDGRVLPDWLAAIAQDIESGLLTRPKPARGRPPGAGPVRHEAAQHNVAELVYVLSGRVQAQGDVLPTYSDTNPEAVTACTLVAQALTEEGVHRTASQVRDAWCAHQDSFEPLSD